MLGKIPPVSFILRQVMLYFFLLTLLLLLLFVLGNLQAFQGETQKMLLFLIDKTTIVFLFTSILLIPIFILEGILYKTFPVRFFLFTILTILFLGSIQFFLKFLSSFLRI